MEHHELLGRLLGCLHRYARSYFEKELAPFGLGSGTFPVLISLLHHGGMNQQELSEQLRVDKATTTRAVTKLSSLGYVRRENDPHDRRAYRLFATQKAKDIAPEVRNVLHSWTAILSDGFTSEEQDIALALLRRMRDNAMAYKHHHRKGAAK